MIYQLSSDGTEYSLISYSGIQGVDEIVNPTILSEINGIPVTSVRHNAFWGFQNLTGTLTIPASIKEIGSSAFRATDIESVIFEEGSPITILNESTFFGCQKLGDVKLPEGLKEIRNSAFASCDLNLKFIDIPASVIDIWFDAFKNCVNLRAVQINGDANVKINQTAFTGCMDNDGFGVTLYMPNIEEDEMPNDWNYLDAVTKYKPKESYTP